MKSFYPFLLLFAFLFSGCDSSVVFNKTEEINLAWNEKHIVSLKTETINHGKYQEILVFRYGDGYPFSKLKIHLKTIGNKETFTDADFMVNIIDKDGNNIGDGLGDIWDIEQPLDTLTIKDSTTIKFQISQKVFQGNLPMVMEVGMKLRKLPE